MIFDMFFITLFTLIVTVSGSFYHGATLRYIDLSTYTGANNELIFEQNVPTLSEKLKYLEGIEVKNDTVKPLVEGIYFVSSTVTINNAVGGEHYEMLIMVDKVNVLKTKTYVTYSSRLTLQVSGFIFVREGSEISVSASFLRNSLANGRIMQVSKDSAFSIQYYGSLGYSEGFLAYLVNNVYSSSGNYVWSTKGKSNYFQIKKGFNPDGVYTTSSDGIYMIYANLMFRANPTSMADFYLKIDNQMKYISSFKDGDDYTSVMVNTVISLKRNQRISLYLNTTYILALMSDSTFSILNIGKREKSKGDIASEITKSFSFNQLSGSYTNLLLKLYKSESIQKMTTLQSNLMEVSTSSSEGLICNQGSYYHVDIKLNLKIDNVENTATSMSFFVGNESLEVTDNNNSTDRVLTLSSALKCNSKNVIQLKYTASKNSKTTILSGTTFSFIEIKKVYPKSLSLKINNQYFVFGSKNSYSVSNFKITNGGDQYEFASSLNQYSINIPLAGIYYISANLLTEGHNNSSLSTCITINGMCNKLSGMYADFSNLDKPYSLKLSTIQYLKKGDTLKLILMSATTSTWKLKENSGFFLLFVGKYLTTPAISMYSDTVKVSGLDETFAMKTNKTNFITGSWLKLEDDTFHIQREGHYLAICSINVMSHIEGVSITYYLRIQKKNATGSSINIGYDEVTIWRTTNFTLSASVVFHLHQHDQLTCNFEQYNNFNSAFINTTVGIVTFSSALVNSNNVGFLAYLDSKVSLKATSSMWQPVPGFVTDRPLGYKCFTTIFPPAVGKFEPSYDGLVLVSAINSFSPGGMYESAIIKTSSINDTSNNDIVLRSYGSSLVAYSGLMEVRKGEEWQLVVRDENNKSTFQVNGDSRWALSTLQGVDAKLPVMLYAETNTKEEYYKSEPYVIREARIKKNPNIYYPKQTGIYVAHTVINATAATSQINSLIMLTGDGITNALYDDQAGWLTHGKLIECDGICVNLGLFTNISTGHDSVKAFALAKIASYNSEAYFSRQKTKINITYDHNFKFINPGTNKSSTSVIPQKSGYFFIYGNINIKHTKSATDSITLCKNMNEIYKFGVMSLIISKASSYSFSKLIWLEKGQGYNINLRSMGSELNAQSDFGIASYLNGDDFIYYASEIVNKTTVQYENVNKYQYLKELKKVSNATEGGFSFVSSCSGTYLLSTNVQIRSLVERDFILSIGYEGGFDLPGLTIQRSLSVNKSDSLHILAPVYLKENKYIGIAIKSNVTGKFYFENVDFSVSSIELDNSDCKEAKTDMWLQPIEPNNIFKSAENSPALKCTPRHSIRSDFEWFFVENGVPKSISNEYGTLSSQLLLRKIKESQSGRYYCRIKRSGIYEDSNFVNVTVIGLVPKVNVINKILRIDENLNYQSKIADINAIAAKKSGTLMYADVFANITNGDNKFSILLFNTVNGVHTFHLFAAKLLDFEKKSLYSLDIDFINLNSTDNGIPYSTKVNLSFIINNVNEPPYFVSNVFNFNLTENTAIGTNIGNVSAKDDGPFKFTLLTTDYFTINSTTGVITIKDLIDYEKIKLYTSYVQISDREFTSYRELNLFVSDLNDNTPFFISPSTITITESTKVGTVIFQADAIDHDSGVNSKLKYTIPSQSTFAINIENGKLSLLKELDYEVATKQIIEITVSDSNPIQSKSSRQNLTVYIVNVNDNNPTFENSTYHYEIREESPPPRLGCVKASDSDRHALIYSLHNTYQNSMSSFFSIDNITGCIASKAVFDYEKRQVYEFTVEVKDNGTVPLTGFAKVVVKIININDNTPTFAKASDSISIVEGTSIGQNIFLLQAKDLDLHLYGKITYNITHGNTDQTFAIESSNIVVLKKDIDRERVGQFYLQIKAFDDGVPMKSSMFNLSITVINRNDNQPYFLKDLFEISINENIANATNVLNITAKDNDVGSILLYSIQNAIKDLPFRIDQNSGSLYTNGLIDFETHSTFTFEVIANDTSNKPFPLIAYTKVVITVFDNNDNVPTLSIVTANIEVSEGTNVDQLIYQLSANDKDSGLNGELLYQIIEGNTGGYFAIENGNQVILKKEIDRETVRKVVLKIKVSDKGVPIQSTFFNLSIDVKDKNDNQPAFVKDLFEVSIAENIAKGKNILNITAIDKDEGATLLYSIRSSYTYFPFVLNQSNGSLYINGSIDFEERSTYSFDVLANDTSRNPMPLVGFTKVVITIVDNNDNAPIFAKNIKSISISEGFHIGHAVYELSATDKDSSTNGKIVYEIINGNYLGKFAIENENNIVLKKELDREATSQYNLEIKASDSGLPKLSAIFDLLIAIVDRNDNQPYFTKTLYEISIEENISSAKNILNVTAKDNDESASLTYSIQNSITNLPFIINTQNGLLYTNGSIDFETHSSYTFDVVANDNSKNPMSLVGYTKVVITVIDKNDNLPLFPKQSETIAISEGINVGQNVYQLLATDKDSGINGDIVYQIISGNSQGSFAIENRNQIIVKKVLDREVVNKYQLEIKASDQGVPMLSAMFNLSINALDRNDNPPYFTKALYEVSIKENIKNGTNILNITATDADENNILLFSIQNAIPNLPFNINHNNGMLYTIGNIDFELHSSYIFDIVVNDNSGNLVSLTGYTKVIITVTDENDNKPIFSTKSGTASVSEGIHVGQIVYQLGATDKDSGLNSDIIYEIVSGNSDISFEIKNRKDVIVKKKLDRETASQYHLEIKASDNGVPTLSSMFNLSITVLDRNDNSPYFSKSLYEVSINENTKNGTNILNVTATDADENNILLFSMQNAIPDIPFSINHSNGMLYTIGNIDFELHSSYTFDIVVNDNSGNPVSLTGYTKVIITVIDVNDNHPIFATKSDSTSVSEGIHIGQVVYQLSATDKDSGLNGDVLYEIMNGNSDTTFAVANNKNIIVKKRLDREKVSQYHLEIKATDNGTKLANIPSFSKFNLTVNVIDENDNQPAFIKDLYEVNLNENTPVDSLVLQVKANDIDETPTLLYSIENANAQKYFYISSINGSVYTRINIDYETVSSVTVILVASDSGTSILKSKSTAVVTIVDLDDNLPIFAEGESTKTVAIFMNTMLGSEVVVIKATDDDSSPNNIIYYEVLTATDFFVINANSGSLTLAKLLTKTDPSQYILQIIAKSNPQTVGVSVPNSSTFTLTITIKPPINNNPVFSSSLYQETVNENLVVGTSVLTVSASAALTSPVKYAIMESFASLPFSIDSTTGVLSVNGAIDYEMYQEHKFYVKSEVIAEPLESSTVPVHINVSNLNDNRPVFEKTYITVSISEKAVNRSSVYQVKATDNDKSNFNNVQYAFERTPPASVNPFGLNQTTGVIYVAKDLDYETTTRYNISISANDNSGLSSTEHATVIINILDVDEIERSSFSKEEIAITSVSIFLILAVVVIILLICVILRK